jgi:hypothetical protein
MSSVQSYVKCNQCGFSEASEVLDCGTNGWWVGCTRCGYQESWECKSRFSNGHLERGVNEVHYSAGALWAEDSKTRVATLRGLAENEIEEIAAKMREAIASGELSSRSYVTKFNFVTGEVTALVGQVPTRGLQTGE